MEILFVLFIVVPVMIASLGAYWIGFIVRKKLRLAGNKYVRPIGIITVIISFLIIFAAIFCLIASNFRIER